jgi:hypothetical protein
VSGYGLEDREIEVRSLAEARDFSSTSVSRPALGPTQPPVQRVPGVLPRRRRDANHLHPSSAEVENEQELYLLSTKRLNGVWWDRFTFLHFNNNLNLNSLFLCAASTAKRPITDTTQHIHLRSYSHNYYNNKYYYHHNK